MEMGVLFKFFALWPLELASVCPKDGPWLSLGNRPIAGPAVHWRVPLFQFGPKC